MNRLERAKQLGADWTVHIDLAKKETSAQLAERIVATIGDHADVTIECSGAESSIQTAIYVSIRLDNDSENDICSLFMSSSTSSTVSVRISY